MRRVGLIALLIPALVLADAPDAGSSFDVPLYEKCPVAAPSVKLDGGYFISDDRASRLACLLETCETHRKLTEARYEEALREVPGRLIGTIAVSVVLGAVGGYMLHETLKRGL